MPRTIPVTITYLEQMNRPQMPKPGSPPGNVALLRAQNIPADYYRYIYEKVGNPYNWVSRRTIRDEDLVDLINHPQVYIFILYVSGIPAGFAEIDARHPKIPEIKFFGLAPEYIGKGYGRYFLTHVIDLAWTVRVNTEIDTQPPKTSGNIVPNVTSTTKDPQKGPERVRLETCTLDHPAALPLYQKFGFTVFDQRTGEVPVIDEVDWAS